MPSLSAEPAVIIGFITALVSGLLTFAKAFGVDITEDQQEAIRGLVAIVAPVVAALVIRSFVFSPASTADISQAAHDAGVKGQAAPVVKV